MAILVVYPDTVEGKKQKTQDQINRMLQQGFGLLKNEFSSLRNLVWNNPHGLTPQQVFDSFGTDARQLVSIKVASATMLNAIVPGTVDPTPPNVITVNEDGTVTVNE